MALSGIISVSGLPGLHKILSQTKNGLIVESLNDGKRRPIYSTQKVSSLEDISIYTMEDDVPLMDVFKMIHEKQGGKKGPDHKSKPEELRKFLSSVLENVDHDKVYNSDVTKLFQWYNSLVEKDMLTFEEEKEEKKSEKKETTKKSTTAKKPVAKKQSAAPKKATAKTSTSKAASKKTAASKKS